ncbi:MAG: GNAT family N-acetyltransferase [Candidatus Thorarchaeota archaeon]|nr:GNAT family N-acetyltransferase [Candidatus Thorarchaeota archaeon]
MREIRSAREADRESLVDLFLTEVEDNQLEAARFASDLLDHLRTILCFVEGKLVGTVSWDIRGGLDDGVIELIGLGVDQKFRRKGVARNLVMSLFKEASSFYSEEGEKLRVVYLFMERTNEDARLFYNALGFQEVALIPSLYPHDDAVVWTKHL